ncbi:putative RNAP1 subunit A [Alcaligenes phage vB_Af_QDWS595]|uniref:RNAP1 subunit A n=1 Tax=Alcaligenes phage vB_Af_QDWS595 TaxID=2877946 RepID=A0AAE9BZV4_9CAUD|nr:putative RNAP1 subunit A [Alcaligenes phage vB_Af_QDWS595]UCR75553.1 putative RNAP1 subunit A [Alcaligenes phage vB_Af_QDWS595]
MAINPANTPSSFAEAYNLQQQSPNTTGGTSAKDKPKTKIWLNVGYPIQVKYTDEQGNEAVREDFISLPLGLSLDDQKPRDLSRITNEEYRNRMAAQNNLLEQLQKGAAELAPGEARIVKLCIQMRHINEDKEAPPVESNPFIKDVDGGLFM